MCEGTRSFDQAWYRYQGPVPRTGTKDRYQSRDQKYDGTRPGTKDQDQLWSGTGFRSGIITKNGKRKKKKNLIACFFGLFLLV